jgi:uncharacterized protein (TIGR02996 family)
MSRDKADTFLEDIIANPDDDTPRLIFADWLEEERGDSDRAEFIRLQIERARLPEWDARQVRLRLRELALLEQHQREWKEELPRIRGVAWDGFRRGFVAMAAFSSFAMLGSKASACWAVAPIEAVSVPWPRRPGSPESILAIPGLRELTIIGNLVARRDLAQLADSPVLSTLRILNVRNCSLGVDGFRRLVASPQLGNLTALRAAFNSIGNGGISALIDAGTINSLTELDLAETGSYGRYGEDPIIEDTGLAELAGWPGFARVRSLTLSGNAVGQAGLEALLGSPDATGLKELAVRNNSLNPVAMQEFHAAPQELHLDVLDLGENLLGERGVEPLASAPCLRELKVLHLDRCELPLAGARQLARAPFFGSLRRLNVSHNSFGPEGLQALLKKKPPELHTLQMIDNDLGDEGVSHLAGSPASDTLLELDLSRNGLKSAAALALAESEHLRNLLILRLDSNKISDRARTKLAGSPLGKRLAILEVRDEDSIPF